MKRADIEVGKEYVRLSPSQEISAWSEAPRIVVLDTDPGWAPSHTGWGSSAPEVTVKDRGERVKAFDYTRLVANFTDRRTVRALVAKRWGVSSSRPTYYVIEMVPVSQIRMTWEEYERRLAEAKEARKRYRQEQEEVAAREEQARQRARAEAQELMRILTEGGQDPDDLGLTVATHRGQLAVYGSLDAFKRLLEVV